MSGGPRGEADGIGAGRIRISVFVALSAFFLYSAALAASAPPSGDSFSAARLVSGSERTVTVVFVARIVNGSTEPVKKPRLVAHAPIEAPQQTIHALDVEGSPERTTDRWNSPILIYERPELAPGQSLVARWTATATIREWQWDLPEEAVAGAAPLPAEQAALNLRDAKYLALTDSGIRAALDEATRDRQGPRARLEGIFDLVMKRLTYDRDNQWDPAPQVLASGKGSCSEYSYCFMALCRADGIPARYVGGLTGRENMPFFLDTVFHRYPQAYVPGAGWADFDPTRNERAKDPRRFFGRTSRLMLLTCVGDGADGSLTGWDYLESHRWEGARTNAVRLRAGWWFASPPPADLKERTDAFRKHLADPATADRRALVDEALAIGHPFVLPWLDDLLYEPATRVAAAKAFLKIGGEAVLRGIVDSLARVPDPEGDHEIGELLNAFTGQSFGANRKKWQEWLKAKIPPSPL